MEDFSIKCVKIKIKNEMTKYVYQVHARKNIVIIYQNMLLCQYGKLRGGGGTCPCAPSGSAIGYKVTPLI